MHFVIKKKKKRRGGGGALLTGMYNNNTNGAAQLRLMFGNKWPEIWKWIHLVKTNLKSSFFLHLWRRSSLYRIRLNMESNSSSPSSTFPIGPDRCGRRRASHAVIFSKVQLHAENALIYRRSSSPPNAKEASRTTGGSGGGVAVLTVSACLQLTRPTAAQPQTAPSL